MINLKTPLHSLKKIDFFKHKINTYLLNNYNKIKMSFLDRLSAEEDAIFERHEMEREDRLNELYNSYPQLNNSLFYAGDFNNNFDTIISNQQQIKILHTYCTCKQCPNKSNYQYIYYSNGPYLFDFE